MRNSTLAACAALASALCGSVMAETVATVQPTPAWTEGQAPMPPPGVGDVLSAIAPTPPAPFGAAARSALTPEASLWYYVEHVRAQQSGRAIPLVESSVKLFETTSGGVSLVPLPGAAWFLVMGLLGVVGVRLQGRGWPSQGPASAVPLPR